MHADLRSVDSSKTQFVQISWTKNKKKCGKNRLILRQFGQESRQNMIYMIYLTDFVNGTKVHFNASQFGD